jgi:hypothetical protein
MRHFSELSHKEVIAIVHACHDGMISKTRGLNMSGLSHLGCHNLYSATEEAILKEWEQSKAVMEKEAANERGIIQ